VPCWLLPRSELLPHKRRPSGVRAYGLPLRAMTKVEAQMNLTIAQDLFNAGHLATSLPYFEAVAYSESPGLSELGFLGAAQALLAVGNNDIVVSKKVLGRSMDYLNWVIISKGVDPDTKLRAARLTRDVQVWPQETYPHCVSLIRVYPLARENPNPLEYRARADPQKASANIKRGTIMSVIGLVPLLASSFVGPLGIGVIATLLGVGLCTASAGIWSAVYIDHRLEKTATREFEDRQARAIHEADLILTNNVPASPSPAMETAGHDAPEPQMEQRPVRVPGISGRISRNLRIDVGVEDSRQSVASPEVPQRDMRGMDLGGRGE
jgi:hypothetical protein